MQQDQFYHHRLQSPHVNTKYLVQPLVAVVQEDSKDRYAATPGDYLLAYTCVAK